MSKPCDFQCFLIILQAINNYTLYIIKADAVISYIGYKENAKLLSSDKYTENICKHQDTKYEPKE